MASFKVLGLLTISCAAFFINASSLKAQVTIGARQPSDLSPAQQILMDMRQTNASAVGGGSIQLLRFTENNVSFAPLEGLDRLFNWQTSEDTETTAEKTLGDRVEEFKLFQRQLIVSDSQIFEAISRISKEN
ncbi:MAG: hypothetical protein ACKO7R_13345 [Pseudanabaena sp.]